MKITITAIVIMTAMISCKGPEIFYGRSFEEVSAIAKEKDRPLCIVLVDHLSYLSDEYAWILREKHADLARKAIYNIVDIENPDNGNDIYLKWLCPVSVPLACLFSPRGELIDLIPGMGDESFSYIEQALEEGVMTAGRWPNGFGLDKAEAIPVLKGISDNRKLISNGIFMADDTARLVDSLKYPYSVSLKLAGEMMTGDSLSAKATAGELLELATPYNMELYKTEFITAHRVVDPGFDIGDEPAIRVDTEIISLGELPADRTVPIEIGVYNDGNKPLIVSDAIPDCPCIRRLGGGDVVVAPRDSASLSFALAPYTEGDIRKNIVLVSNGINQPLLNINIQATFKSEQL